MIDGKRVVAWTPAGRQNTMEILLAYLQRDHDKGLVDKYWMCKNTDPNQADDLAWMKITSARRDWVKVVERPKGVFVHERKQRNTGYFYRYMCDPDTVYVRFDDDVVWVDEKAIERLVLHKIDNEAAACSFAMIINNAICSYFLQKDGKIPMEWGEIKRMYCMESTAWGNGRFAVQLHEWFLEHIRNGTVSDLYSHHDYQLPLAKQFSVSCFASLGSMYASLPKPGVLQHDEIIEEESWHTKRRPRETKVPNEIVGNAFVSHYSFYTQHPHLNAHPNILEGYRTLAKEL